MIQNTAIIFSDISENISKWNIQKKRDFHSLKYSEYFFQTDSQKIKFAITICVTIVTKKLQCYCVMSATLKIFYQMQI